MREFARLKCDFLLNPSGKNGNKYYFKMIAILSADYGTNVTDAFIF